MSFKEDVVMESKGMVYLPIINEAIVRKNEEYNEHRRSRSKKAVHPSGIHKACLRQLYYAFNKTPQRVKTAKKYRRLDAGNDMHNKYDRYAKQAGILVKKEMKLRNKEHKIRARLDQLILLPGNIEQPLRIIELKSMQEDLFKALNGNPHYSHICQINMYMWLINEMFKNKVKNKIFTEYGHLFPITKGAVVIENVNTCDADEFLIEYDENLVQTLLKKASELILVSENTEPPPRGSDYNSRDCKWCDYRDTICWSSGGKQNGA